MHIPHLQGGEWGRSNDFGFFPPVFFSFPNSLTEDIFVVSLAPPTELAVFGGDLVVVVEVIIVAVVVVAAIVTGSKVEEGLGLEGGERIFLPSSMSRSKTNPMTALRCGVWPSAEVLSEATNNSSLAGAFRLVSDNRRSSVRIVVCLWRISLKIVKYVRE